MRKITIWIPGQPARVTHQSGTRYTTARRTYKTQALKDWEAELYRALKPYVPAEPFAGPISLDVTFHFRAKRKKDYGTWKITRPDTDNMVKTLKDVMTRMGFWGDDSQIAFEICKKLYVDEPGIRIIVNQLTEKAEEKEWHTQA